MHSAISMMNRRRALALFGGAGVAAIMRADTACVATSPAMTEGPYWIEEKLFRSVIRTDPATGIARPGVPLNLSINVRPHHSHHVRVRTYSGATVLDNFITQLFFDDTVSNAVLSQAPYTRSTSRDTTN